MSLSLLTPGTNLAHFSPILTYLAKTTSEQKSNSDEKTKLAYSMIKSLKHVLINNLACLNPI